MSSKGSLLLPKKNNPKNCLFIQVKVNVFKIALMCANILIYKI